MEHEAREAEQWLFQGALRDSGQSDELGLCQAPDFKRARTMGELGSTEVRFAPATLDFTHTVQDPLPDIAVRFESGERAAGEFPTPVKHAIGAAAPHAGTLAWRHLAVRNSAIALLPSVLPSIRDTIGKGAKR